MKGLSDIVKTACRFLAGPLILFGAYLFTHAAHSHGVGFGGGLIIALTVVMLVLSFGRAITERILTAHRALRVSIVGIMGMLLSGMSLLFGFPPWLLTLCGDSTAVIVVTALNICLCVTAASALMLIFFSLMRNE